MTEPRRRWYDDPTSAEFAEQVASDPWRLHVIQKLDDLAGALLLRWSIVFVGLIAVGVWTAITYANALSTAHNVERFQVSNTKALCTLRHDVQLRVSDSEKFLILHPNGIPGISAATIRQSIASEQQTVTALSSLRCPPDE